MNYINTIDSKVLFQGLLDSQYFVDKTGLISAVVPCIGKEEKYLCITRPRRFGKSCNARMLACFLSRGLDVDNMFSNLKVAKDKDAMEHLGAHNVIYIDFSLLPFACENYKEYITSITNGIIKDARQMFPELKINENEKDIFLVLSDVYSETKIPFIFVMDEWDSMFFNDDFTKSDQKHFLMFLKQLLKGRSYVELAYMTGVLPIAKHSTGSELNMFTEFSAVDDPRFDESFGFTVDEVHKLCKKHEERLAKLGKTPKVDFGGLEYWYDGYFALDGSHRFNPRSVALALNDDYLKSYWTESGPYGEIYFYVKNNIADVRDDLARMVAKEPVHSEMENYAASSMSLTTKDEIFSAMVVYGFLTYHDGCVSIPNYELMLQFQKLMKKEDLGYIAKLAKRSKETLAATLRKDEETIAQIIEAAHDEEIPLLRYAYEADLAALINLVYLAARDKYFIKREQPCGKGVADVAFIPQNSKDANLVPFIVELKVAQDSEDANTAAKNAIKQIKERGYSAIFADALTEEQKFANTPLAVGISWDAKTKKHACVIEEY